MMRAVPRTYGGISDEQRRADRRERLLETGLDLLGREGLARVTVRNVCQAARLNPRYFYESFDGLDALLVEVFDRAMATTTAAVAAALAADDHATPEAAIRAGVGAFIDATTADARVARVLFLEALGNETLMRRRLDTAAAFAKLAASWAQPDPPDHAAGEMVAGGLVQLILASLEGRLPGGRAALRRHAEDLTLTLLRRGGGAAST